MGGVWLLSRGRGMNRVNGKWSELILRSVLNERNVNDRA